MLISNPCDFLISLSFFYFAARLKLDIIYIFYSLCRCVFTNNNNNNNKEDKMRKKVEEMNKSSGGWSKLFFIFTRTYIQRHKKQSDGIFSR